MAISKNKTRLGEVTKTPNMEVVAFLKGLLEQAESGEVRAIACVGSVDGTEDFQFIHGQETSGELFKFMGLLEMAKVQITAELTEGML